MTTTAIDLDTLPPDTVVAKNGQITPIGKPVIAKLAKELADICRQADDPQAALRVVLEVIPKHMAEIVSRRTSVDPSPLRTALTSLAGSQCLERRPGRDPLTGDGWTASRTLTTPGPTACCAPSSMATPVTTVTPLGGTGNERRFRHDDSDP
ncbi:hypothetical protein [Streptomyces sp. CC219B]|uniref:hypothetical protein n=1 Tax=Streptomyces sp. CC219B TaxID=3044574 RepID=UPI0024A7CA65|nr:hypothetical protein [Streptomyces sp. CC219B]